MGSVEDTPETVGMLGKKLPTFRMILIEVSFPQDADKCASDTFSVVTLTAGVRMEANTPDLRKNINTVC